MAIVFEAQNTFQQMVTRPPKQHSIKNKILNVGFTDAFSIEASILTTVIIGHCKQNLRESQGIVVSEGREG